MTNQEIYWKIYHFTEWNLYVYVIIPICLVGLILNLLNALVFTRKTMKNSSPNTILTHLAFVDFLLLLSHFVQFWVVNIQFKSASDLWQSYEWVIIYWYNGISTTTFQFISAFLTVQLAAWRYIAVVHPLKERRWCTQKITRNIVITGYVLCCVTYAIPFRLSFDIVLRNKNGTTYFKATSKQHPIMHSIIGIIYALVIKVLSSLVLAGLTSRIVVALLARKTRREQLSPSSSTRSGMKNVKTRQQTNRSTAILLAVVALFFIAEFPRGILWLLVTINYDDWSPCYYSLVQIFMTINLINTSITFIIYFTLSQQFRTTFKSLFNLNKHTISHQTNTPLALGDTGETESGIKTSGV